MASKAEIEAATLAIQKLELTSNLMLGPIRLPAHVAAELAKEALAAAEAVRDTMVRDANRVREAFGHDYQFISGESDEPA